MVCRIEVGSKPGFPDPAGSALQKRICSELGLQSVRAARVISVYLVDAELSDEEANKIAAGLFSDPVVQQFSVNKPLFEPSKFSFAISVGFRPGVKDNAGDAAKEAIEDLLSKKLPGEVYTSKNYILSGSLSKSDAQRIAHEMLANELIERFQVLSSSEFGEDGFGSAVPRVQIAGGGLVCQIDLDVPDKKLSEISHHRVLSLSLAEMKAIRDHYLDLHVANERKKAGLSSMPTDVELEAIAQTWSEHCKHKIFNAMITVSYGKSKKKVNSLFSTYVKSVTKKLSSKKKWLVSVFSDNAGIFEFVPGWNVAMKVETHNTPSALDPFGGALTGILGVNRDILGCGLGAKPIFNTDVFCFADPNYSGEIPPRLFHPRRVLEGVRSGVAHGGNASGIPTINGSLVFDGRYLGKPLVYCGTGGLMPSQINGRKTHEKRAMPEDRIFMAGGRIGKDGIHGATFSSVELHEGSPVSAVQLGDPYTQKKLHDFLIEARDKGLYSAVTDNGAGGLSSSVCEMAESCGGCTLHLDRAPLKYPGLDPWEILLSESQERMTFAVPPSCAGEFVSLARLRGVEVSDMGEFNQSGFVHVKYGAKPVAHIDMNFLHHGLPRLELEAELKVHKQQKEGAKKAKAVLEKKPEPVADYSNELLLILSRPNICSKEYIIRQYDHEVQGSSVIKPLCGTNADGPSDAGVIAPILGRKEGLVVSNGICPRYSDLDCYQMAANALDEAVRNYVASGGSLERLAALDNFCWADPIFTQDNLEGKHRLAQLVLSCRGLHDGCLVYGVPLISGKDSMKNDYRHGKWRISVPPTLLVTAIGKIDDVSLSMTTDFKSAGDTIFVLGQTHEELGGSEYHAMKGISGGEAPRVNFRRNFALYKKLQNAIQKGLVSSCHDCSEGGLVVALAECCIGGRLGAEVSLDAIAGKRLQAEAVLFSESAGRFIVSVRKSNEKAFLRLMRGMPAFTIGKVTDVSRLTVGLKGKKAVDLPLEQILLSWKGAMDW